MQTITITGFLSKDAETQTTQGGDSVTRWNVPVDQGWGDSKTTNWFRVSIWGKRAGFASNARKGDMVAVTGELTIGDYQGKPQYEVRANDFAMPRKSRDDQRTPDGSQGAPADRGGWAKDDDSDIPFVTSDGIL
jgi:single-strand DNA-binding protein